MKKLWKILIPALVIISVLACLFAVGAFAETTEGTEGTDNCWEIFDKDGKSVSKQKKLYSSVNACPDGGTIRALFDKINWNGDFADFRNLNKTVTIDFGTSTVVYGASQANAFNFIDNSNIILKGDGATLEIPAGKRFCDMTSGNLTVDGVNITVNSGRILNTTISEGQTIEFRNCELTTLGTTSNDRMFVITSAVNTNPLKFVNCTLTGYSDQMFVCDGGWIDISGTSKVNHLCKNTGEPLLYARSNAPYTRFTVASGVRFNRDNVAVGSYTEDTTVARMLTNDSSDAAFPYVRAKAATDTSSESWLAYRKADGTIGYHSSLYSAGNEVADGGTIYSIFESVSYEGRDGLLANGKSITLDLGKTVFTGTFTNDTSYGMIVVHTAESSVTVKGDGAVINIVDGNKFTSGINGPLTVEGVTINTSQPVLETTVNSSVKIVFRNCNIESTSRVICISAADTATSVDFENVRIHTTADDAFVCNGGWINITGNSAIGSTEAIIYSRTGYTMKLTIDDGTRLSHNSLKAGNLTSDSTSIYGDYIYNDPSSDATFPCVLSHEKATLVFNYGEKSANCSDTWKIENATAAMAKFRYTAYLDGKVITGWSKTDGGAAETVSVSYADLGKTVNYYAVTSDFSAAGVKYVILSGENILKYGNADSFYGVEGKGDFGDIAAKSEITVVFVDDMTVYGAAEISNLAKVSIDLNGHTITADTTNWKTSSVYNYIFRIQNAGTETHIYSSKPGAVINSGSYSVVMLNWTGDLYIGSSSYSGNLTLVTGNRAVNHNASGNVTVTGTKINAAYGFEFALRSKDVTFTLTDCDVNVDTSFIHYTRDEDQTKALTANIENSNLFIKENLVLDNDAMNSVNTDITFTGSTLYVSDISLPEKVSGSVTITGGKAYVNTADDNLTLDSGKALCPTVVTKNGVVFTNAVAGEKEIAGIKFNLTLYSNFNLNIYVLADYKLAGETVEIDGHMYTRLEYKFAAHEIAKAQSIKLGDYDAISISVLDYAKALFALDDSALMAGEKTLMADALVYANAAAKLIDKAENDEITALLGANDYKSTLLTFDGVKKDMSSVSDGFISASLDLTSQPKFVFTIAEGAKVSVSYTNFWGTRVTKTQDDAVDGKIVIDNMRIFDFANEFTLTVGEKSATYSLKDYAAGTDVKDLCNALYTYIETAKAFKTANPKV